MEEKKEFDAFMIGTGIMSATLATLLQHLEPTWKIGMADRFGNFPTESSAALNNAGTGHSGFCELNYDVPKAIKVCEAFEKSKQFWSYLVHKRRITSNFIHSVPHISFVKGQENVDLLKKRWQEMKKICLFKDMEFSDDPLVLKQWMPLVMHSRNRGIPMAATRIKRGTDIDFGALTSDMLAYLTSHGVDMSYFHEVIDIKRNDDKWDVTLQELSYGKKTTITTKFLFIGAGGASLTLLEKSGIAEAKGYGGFPVSGQFLMCDNPKVVAQHQAKVYGKPSIGAPPMSVPHLDTRIIGDKKVLLFGPYAGFSPKFLKSGHWTDFFSSLRFSNIFTIISAGVRNFGLSKYLFKEVTKNHNARIQTLLEYYPNANPLDWKPITAGQRVQVIKKSDGIPTIEFGTEIVSAADGSLAALLGASPGASTSVKIMLDLIKRCFPNQMEEWGPSLNAMIPSHGKPLHEDEEFFNQIEDYTSATLGLNNNAVLV
jgi:malate dehydrogenase (quinone)